MFNDMTSSENSTNLMVVCPACLRRIGALGGGGVSRGIVRSSNDMPIGFGGRGAGISNHEKIDYVLRYQMLYDWFLEHGGGHDSSEVQWISERYYSITGQQLPMPSRNSSSSSGGFRSENSTAQAPLSDCLNDTANATPILTHAEQNISRDEMRSKLKLLKSRKRVKR